MTFIVHINGYEHRLAGTAIADLKARILAAVRAGGEFVDMSCADPGSDMELVTPATLVRIERAPSLITADDLDGGLELVYLDS